MIYFSLGGSGGGSSFTSVNIIPAYSASSTWTYSKPVYTAFDYIENTDMRNINDAWTSNTNDNTPYLQIFIPSGVILKKITIKVFSNYSGAWSGDVKITASEDGTNFVDLTEAETVTAPLQEFATHEFNFTNNTAYKYYRIQGTTAFAVYNNASIFFDQVEAYT